MSILFDDSPVMLFASAAGLIMCFDLVFAIPVVSATSEKDDKHSCVVVLAFLKGSVIISALPQSTFLLRLGVSAHRNIIYKAFAT